MAGLDCLACYATAVVDQRLKVSAIEAQLELPFKSIYTQETFNKYLNRYNVCM